MIRGDSVPDHLAGFRRDDQMWSAIRVGYSRYSF